MHINKLYSEDKIYVVTKVKSTRFVYLGSLLQKDAKANTDI